MLRKSLALMLASAVTGIILCYPQPAQAYCPQTSDATPRGPIALNEQGEFVPDWAKSAVWYQVFPERFRDGDPSNNPTVGDIAGADPAEPPKVWQIHPWGSDWYKLQPYEVANGEPEVWKHLLRRRYGGDLQGVIDKLPIFAPYHLDQCGWLANRFAEALPITSEPKLKLLSEPDPLKRMQEVSRLLQELG